MTGELTPPPEVTLPMWTVTIDPGHPLGTLVLHVQTHNAQEAIRLARDWLDATGIHYYWQGCPTAVHLTENPPRGRIDQ